MSAVSVRDLVRRYGRTRVLDSLHLDVAPGEKVAVLGPNGSGKTTLLRVVAGLLRPDSGSVTVGGGDPAAPRTRTRTGYLGHVPSVYPRLTAAENVRFWSGLHGRPAAAGLELLARVGLDPGDRRTTGAYSQGMRRRVGLACALAHDPEVLLLDEPFAGLDSAGADTLTTLLTEVGRTLLVATHEPDRASHFCDRLLVLERGRLEDAR